MPEYSAEQSKDVFQQALHTARSLRHELSQRSLGATTIEARITGNTGGTHGGGPVTGVIPCIFIIQSATIDEAFEHAKDLEKQGCTCTSTGETEITCKCPD